MGFRPDVYRLARRHGISGYVKNVAGGAVEVWAEGEAEALRAFVKELIEMPPPARVEEYSIREVRPKGYSKFVIAKSERSLARSQIPPDLAVCEECLKETLDPFARRYRYPLTSCAKCGPRFSMLYELPYDRENTSMRHFPFCAECEREYGDPEDRRFHAQGFACAKCGPKVKLLDSEGKTIIVKDPVREAAKLVDEGFIVAVKGMGGYHLAVRATDDRALAELRKRKNRPRKPFALMALNVEVANEIVVVTDRELFESPEAPIVLFPKRRPSPLSELVAPGHELIGVMRAYTPLHYMLLMETEDKFSVMTSANPTGKPTCINKECVISMGVADYVLEHEREIVHRVDDSVVRVSANKRLFLRRGRGYAPRWVELRTELKEGVAVGAELQNAGAISFGNKVVLTQYIGDTDDLDVLEFLREELKWFIEQYSIKPEFVAADMHPRYNTKLLARELEGEFGVPLIEVQHHHAHAVSAMADNGLEEAIAITVDGTGYGIDGNSWGGEVLLADYLDFKRLCHLEYLPLPGGDRAVKYPARIALAALNGIGEDLEKWKYLMDMLPGGKTEATIALRQAKTSIMTSSLGRTLDMFSALLKISWERSYEGEPAMLLEAASFGGALLARLDLIESRGGECVISTTRLLRWVVDAIRSGMKVKDIAYTVQYNLGYNMALVASEHDLPLVVSGGAAVNEPFLKGVMDVKEPILPKRVPPGDGGISLGQIVVASKRLS